jgi:hypothetical protein
MSHRAHEILRELLQIVAIVVELAHPVAELCVGSSRFLRCGKRELFSSHQLVIEPHHDGEVFIS